MKIGFVGTGYVGLVSGVMMSEFGHNVTCIDLNQDKISKLEKGISPIYEPGLDEYITKNLHSNMLNFCLGYSESLKDIDAFFITVGTPSKIDGSAELSFVYESIDQLIKFAKEDVIVVIKSTVPPGTTQNIADYVSKNGAKFKIANNPEFLREGSAISDFVNPDRIVVGVDQDSTGELLQEIYKPLIESGIEFVKTDFVTGELIKYASNTFLANKIAFINEMADLCETIGADITDLSYAVGLDRRIGKEFLNAGPGFGGSCFPKDILALQNIAHQVDSQFLILDAIINANSNRPIAMIKKISKIIGDLKNKNITILGLTYKAGTDDIRSSPATQIAHLLSCEGAKVFAFDPMASEDAKLMLPNVKICSTAYEACKDSDCIVIATEWGDFKELDYVAIASMVKNKVIIDLRTYLDSSHLIEIGYKYYSVGRRNGA